MKKTTIVLLALLALSIVSASVAFAYGRGAQGLGIGTYHEEMEDIMSNGTYSDLVEFRNEIGYNMMPWVENQEDFNLASERHNQMEQWQNQNQQRYGYGRGFGRGGCPMSNGWDYS